YYSFFDTAVNGWLMSATGTDIRELDAVGVVAETSCRFLAQLSFPDELRVGIAVEKLGTSSIVYSL
ncbi:acyl-CoA thioesterase, partial [Rhodococcoides kroppenstedtii]